MRLLILGATGRVGREMVKLALQDGHEVVALVRSPEKAESLRESLGALDTGCVAAKRADADEEVCAQNVEAVAGTQASSNLRIVLGDARSYEHVLRAMAGAEAVLCSLNTDGGTMLSESMAVILDAMRAHGVLRIVSIGTAGILQARSEPHLLRYRSSESRRTTTAAAEDHERAYQLLAATEEDVAWTLVCPTYLPEGPATGAYRVERDVLPEGGMRITTGDTAEFAYRQLQSTEFLRCRVGIAE